MPNPVGESHTALPAAAHLAAEGNSVTTIAIDRES
jgi:hypothetical protein